MIKETLEKLYEIFELQFYNLPYSIRLIWQVIGLIFGILLIISILHLFYIFFKYINKSIKKLDYINYVYRSRKLYNSKIPSLKFISDKYKNKNIGGSIALIQTNWQFRRKNGNKYIVREPEELGFREITDRNTLVSRALENSIDIKEVALCTDYEEYDENYYYVEITLKNLTDKRLDCIIPKGQIFENEDTNSKTQNLAATDRMEFNIPPSPEYQVIIVPAYCLNHSFAEPNGQAGRVTIFEVMFKNFENQDQLWRLIERQNTLIEAEGYTNNSKPDLIKAIIQATLQLQGLGKTINQDEDSRNSFIALVLNNKGFKAKDQTKWGISEKGEKAGEIDIKIEDEENDTISICEGFNLEYCNKAVISSHLIKIFNYDVNGLERNYIIVYAEAKNFISLWEKYLKSIRIIRYPYELITNVDDVSKKHCRVSDIKIGLGLHKRNESITELYHIFVNMNFVG